MPHVDLSERRDSQTFSAGAIPGLPEAAAFSLFKHDPSPIPIVLAVPHAGRSYPPELLDRMRCPAAAVIKLEDRYVDLIAAKVAQRTGATLLIAHAPRAMIDLNRAADEMDWDMLRLSGLSMRRGFRLGRRARSGLGLIPRRLPGLGEIWKQRMDEAELRSRIDLIHEPYHRALARCLQNLRARWGAALLIDMHSMPPLARRWHDEPAQQFVLGDRFGGTCDGALCAAAFQIFAQQNRRAAHNRPYAGGYVLERHSAPLRGIHAMQMEICRSTYLDSALAEPQDGGVDDVADLFVALVRRLASEVAGLGGAAQLPQAAE